MDRDKAVKLAVELINLGFDYVDLLDDSCGCMIEVSLRNFGQSDIFKIVDFVTKTEGLKVFLEDNKFTLFMEE